jgi:hypothetical protein
MNGAGCNMVVCFWCGREHDYEPIVYVSQCSDAGQGTRFCIDLRFSTSTYNECCIGFSSILNCLSSPGLKIRQKR